MFWGREGDGLGKEFVCKVRRWDKTYFWKDRWVGEDILKVDYRRLFRISVQQTSKSLKWGGGRERYGNEI